MTDPTTPASAVDDPEETTAEALAAVFAEAEAREAKAREADVSDGAEKSVADGSDGDGGDRGDTPPPAAPTDTDTDREGLLDPPVRWTPERQKVWAEAEQFEDPKIRDYAKRLQETVIESAREAQGHYTQSMQKLSEQRAAFDAERQQLGVYEGVIGPVRDSLRRDGIADDGRYLAETVKLERYAASQPAEFARWFIQHQGLTPQQLGLPAGKSVTRLVDTTGEVLAEYDTPSASPASVVQQPAPSSAPGGQSAEMQALMNQIQQLGGVVGAMQQSQEQAALNRARAEIAQMSAAVDEQGHPQYPYLEELRAQMANLLDANLAQTPSAAYEQAAWADPNIRSQMLARQTAAADAKRRAEVARAQRAAAHLPVSAAAPAPARPSADETTAEALSAVWDDLSGRSDV